MSLFHAIAECCVFALKREVYTAPKPGLVDRLDNGAHQDMDLALFYSSAQSLTDYFRTVAQTGAQLPVLDEHALEQLRPLGIQAESTMLAATGGVNTHKGAIFSMGLLAAAAGFACAHQLPLAPDQLCRMMGKIARPALSELIESAADSHGLHLYRKLGVTGIRAEAALGFPSVVAHALPALRAFPDPLDGDIPALQALLALMCHVEDTNVLHRAGPEGLAYMRQTASQLLAQGGAATQESRVALHRLNEEYCIRNISPGGCADLLAVSLALIKLERL